MKKLFASVLSALMLMASLTACGGKEDKKVSTDDFTSISKVINAW